MRQTASDAVAIRVAEARRIQARRFDRSAATAVNAAMDDRQMRSHCPLERPAQRMLDAAFEQLGLSARALVRILKVSRTLADLGGRSEIAVADVAEAIQYRTLDRRLTA